MGGSILRHHQSFAKFVNLGVDLGRACDRAANLLAHRCGVLFAQAMDERLYRPRTDL
jgi:hypothetical protein